MPFVGYVVSDSAILVLAGSPAPLMLSAHCRRANFPAPMHGPQRYTGTSAIARLAEIWRTPGTDALDPNLIWPRTFTRLSLGRTFFRIPC